MLSRTDCRPLEIAYFTLITPIVMVTTSALQTPPVTHCHAISAKQCHKRRKVRANGMTMTTAIT